MFSANESIAYGIFSPGIFSPIVFANKTKFVACKIDGILMLCKFIARQSGLTIVSVCVYNISLIS